ncbi:hypothetical protein MMC26_007713 [Xylographa opegraphella]|nr:hypothetical protein [Xylographa opegraphella]
MPTRLAAPVLMVDANKMHKIDTRNAENLFGMWQVFSRCAESMEEGRRLENLSWRIWNRETFCCESQPQLTTTPMIELRSARLASKDLPELSASVDSLASDYAHQPDSAHSSNVLPVDIVRTSPASSMGSFTSSRGREKHLTSLGLEKMVQSIKEKKDIVPLSPSITENVPLSLPTADTTPRSASPARKSCRQSSDSSTTSTGILSILSCASDGARAGGSDTSAELVTSHSVVRGFSPSQISSSFRSHTHLAPTPVPAKSSLHPKTDDSKRKAGLFMLGGSSGEDESSFEEKMSTQPSKQSSLTAGLKNTPSDKKQTSFKDEVESRTISNRSHEDEDVFESDDEENVSESAIEDEEDSSDWEDSATDSGTSSVNEKHMFQRVDSRPHLPSRRSLLTTLIHQPDRAAALAEQALKSSKSQPVLHRRSRTSSPNGPSVAASPDEDSMLPSQEHKVPGARPIIMTTSNIHPPALSPRTTRRNMLATELTESLRKHLLWERQQKNTTANAVLKRRHTAHDMANLKKFPDNSGSGNTSKNNSWNNYFDHGLGEYHQKGW